MHVLAHMTRPWCMPTTRNMGVLAYATRLTGDRTAAEDVVRYARWAVRGHTP